MSDLGSWQEQRRRDRLADREQDRADTAARAVERREDRRLEREQDRADRAAARSEKRQDKAGRAERWRTRRAWLVDHGALMCTGVVMACAIVPALAAQFTALSTAGVGPLLAALLAAMLEGGAWAATFGAAEAARQDRPTGRYRAATWACAAVAAAINFSHGSHDYGLWLGVVLAVASLFAVGMWELHLNGSHTPSREERERARHERRRRWHHRKVCRIAGRLITAAPHGTLTAEEAFIAAWRVHHGANPGLTAQLLADRLAAEAGLGEVVEQAADSGPQRVTARLWTVGDEGLPVLGRTCPVPLKKQENRPDSVADRSMAGLRVSAPVPLDGSADSSAARPLAPLPVRPVRKAADGPAGKPRSRAVAESTGSAPRRATGRVPVAARYEAAGRRTDDELLDTARKQTAAWPDDELNAERLRTTLRIGAAKARYLRDILQAERAEITAQFQDDETDRRHGLHLVTDDAATMPAGLQDLLVPSGGDR
ncbi:hypothetical protein BLA24_20415 [Streptomyces cinnamoneus]|uniref:Uncharacterized protein n=1 Tax=Streptomyces cinnamoneus TaxID=53446 RepID=A0A2G1XFJ8_STRCJ|nr:DUF2637 domain-containing protein [Streptomyces cinnamoneus]PHQ49981.1 hypothetical protein BLA24_20415 [Streptomyces cinnamoneus]PPT13242.1 DUF2637 domain-containing protein [Streptomyces cinnamoneus]